VFFFLAATVCVVWLLSPAAQFIWLVLPIASLVQFPWRLLGVAVLTTSVVAAALYPFGQHVVFKHAEDDSIELNAAQHPAWEQDTLPVELWVVALVVVLGSFSYTLPQYTQVEAWRQQSQAVVRWDQFSPADRVGMVVYTQEQPTTSPMESQYLSGTPLQVATILNGSGTLETVRHGGASDEIQVYLEESSIIQFYTYDYPGWRVWMDGQPISHRNQEPHGLIVVDVPPGDHHLELRMTPTLPRLLGGALSLAALVIIAIGLLRKHIWRRQGRLL
jgi:hypothetical protein